MGPRRALPYIVIGAGCLVSEAIFLRWVARWEKWSELPVGGYVALPYLLLGGAARYFSDDDAARSSILAGAVIVSVFGIWFTWPAVDGEGSVMGMVFGIAPGLQVVGAVAVACVAKLKSHGRRRPRAGR